MFSRETPVSESSCRSCQEKCSQVENVEDQLTKVDQNMKRLAEILKQDDVESIVKSVGEMISEIDSLNCKIHELQEESESLSKRMNEEKYLEDISQSEKIKTIEIQMAEKENQLLRTSNNVRGQLATAKEEVSHLSKEVERFENYKNMSESGSWQQEAESLQLVLEMRKQELDKLKAANNSLLLQLERIGVVEVQLQVGY